MINACFEEYCQKCPHIEAKAEVLYAGFQPYITNISCVHRNKCKNIAKVIKKALKEKEKEGND